MSNALKRAGLCLGTVVLVSTLTACGGGGGGSSSGDSSAAATFTYPSTGYYNPAFRWSGNNQVGVSLLHASTPSVEYVISAAAGGSPVTGVDIVNSETMVSGTAYLQPGYLLYVQGGVLYDLPLQANGNKPVAAEVPLGAVKACTIPYWWYASSAQAAQLIVTTAGADGACGTSDDGQVRVNLANPVTNSTVQSLGAGYTYLGHIDSGVAGQPPVWLESDANGALYTDAGNGPQLLRAATGTTPSKLADSLNSLLMQDGGQLSMVSYSSSANAWQIVPVSGSAGTWISADSDSSNYYVYANSGSGTSTTWQLLAIPQAGAAASLIGSGAGTVSTVSLGNQKLFVSTVAPSTSYLYLVAKNGSGTTTADTNTPTTTGTIAVDRVFVLSGSKDVLYRAFYSGSIFAGGQINTIDETGLITQLAATGQPCAFVFPPSIPLSALGGNGMSFITSYSQISGYAGGELETYDSTTGVVTSNGILPTASVVGGYYVNFAGFNVYGAVGGLFVAGQNSAGFLPGAAQMYSYDPAVAGSLTLTTTQE